MSSHRRIHQLLYDFVTGGLDSDQRTLVERHVQRCMACKRECAELREALQGLPVESDPAAHLPPAFWRELLNDVEAQLPAHPPPQRVPRWITDWMAFIAVPRRLAITAATTILVLGGIITGMWLAFQHTPEPKQIVAAPPPPPSHSAPVFNTRLKDYLRKSKVLLVELNNMPLHEGTPVDLSIERSTSRALLHEARYLEDQPLDRASATLIADLEKIQIALANSREREDIPELRLIRGGIQKENLLFKIRIAETVFTRINDGTQHADQ
jgi:hypothetical protein